jgi:hypothetical protein
MHVPAGSAMTITTDGVSSVIYVQKTPGNINTPGTVAASTTSVVGPFNDARDYEITFAGNSPTVSVAASGVFTAADEAGIFIPSEEANVAEIANDATGTAIATAVTGILAILIANGMMEAPE